MIKCNSIIYNPNVLLKRLLIFFGGEGEDNKTFKIHLIEDIFVNIHHTPLFLGEIIKKNKSISYLKSRTISFCYGANANIYESYLLGTISTLCSLITLLRMIQERRGGGKYITTILSIVLAYKNRKQKKKTTFSIFEN